LLHLRVLSALFLAPLAFLLVYLGGPAWVAAVLVIGVLGWREMAHLQQRVHFTVHGNLGFFFIIGAVVEAYVQSLHLVPGDLLRPLLAGLIVFSLIWALFNTREHPTADWGITVASALYLGFMLGHFVTLRLRPDGMYWTYYAILMTWVSDTGAYFVGRAIGKRKLWPRISPKKTWEGLAGGTIASLVAGPLLGHWLLGLNPWLGIALGALIATAAPFGDFAISLFKRMAQIKDSSGLIPGHGGILDRLDSLLFTIPVVTYFVVAVAGW
jgi:phosphatidate cytidylyltransferase